MDKKNLMRQGLEDRAIERAARDLESEAVELLEPVSYDGFGAPLYRHQIGPEGTE